MVLPTGLVSVLVFVVTIGIPGPVTLAALWSYRRGVHPFQRALQMALLEAAVLYLVGVGIVWAVVGSGFDPELWEIPATLLIIGASTFLGLTLLPLAIGQRLVQLESGTDPESALRFTVYGWAVSMLLVFVIFMAPGGFSQGNLLNLGGSQICLFGFCGINIWFGLGVLLLGFIVLIGPGLIGIVIRTYQTSGD